MKTWNAIVRPADVIIASWQRKGASEWRSFIDMICIETSFAWMPTDPDLWRLADQRYWDAVYLNASAAWDSAKQINVQVFPRLRI